MPKQKRFDKHLLVSCLPWFCLVGAIVAALCFQWAFNRTMLDSDMAAELILANQLNEEGHLLSTNWFYSTELSVFSQQLVYKVGLWVFPHDWHAARTVGLAIMLFFAAGASLLLCRAAKLGRAGVYVTAAMMCPLSFWYHFHVIFGGLYTIFYFCIPFIAWLVLRLAQGATRGKTITLYLVLSAFSLLCGLNGVRMLMCLHLPLIVAGFFMLVLYLHENELRKPYFAVPEVRMFVASVISAGFSGIGFLVNGHILDDFYHFSNQNGRTWSPLSLSGLLDSLSDFFALYGYPAANGFITNVSLFSKEGLLGAFGALLSIGLLVCTVRVAMHWRRLRYEQKYLLAVLASCLLVMGVSFTCTAGALAVNGSYWLPVAPFGFYIFAVEVQTEDFRLGLTTKRLLAALFAFSVLASSTSTVMTFFKQPVRANTAIIPVADWLTENGYTNGYATFWNSNLMTELTNGELNVWTVQSMETLQLQGWLQTRSHLTPPEGRVFLLIKKADTDYEALPYLREDAIVYEDDSFLVLAFDDAEIPLKAAEAAQAAAEAAAAGNA